MTPVAELRVYLPLDELPETERPRWAALAARHDENRADVSSRTVVFEAGRLEVLASVERLGGDGAFWRTVDGRIYVCPWRNRRRALVAVLAARQQFPDAVVEGIVPAADADRAAAALEAMCRAEPGAEVQILESAFHVPVRWFSAFDDGERILSEDERGLSLRYEADLTEATARVRRATDLVARVEVPASSAVLA